MVALALLACLGVGLAGCAAPTLAQPAGSGRPRPVAGSDGGAKTGCPRGRLLPAGQGVAIDYVDFLRFNGRSYDVAREHITASQLGQVVTHIRCSLTARQDQRHGPAPIINGTASFLPVGTTVYAVHGYRPACRLAAYLNGRLHVYLDQAAAPGQATGQAARCAWRRA
jgi:hypothetical protein